MGKFNIQRNGKMISVFASSDYLCKKKIRCDDSQYDIVSCTAKTGFVFLNVFLNGSLDTTELAELILKSQHSGQCTFYKNNTPPIILTPPYRYFGRIGYRMSKSLMSDVMRICSENGGRSIRFTQYGLLRSGHRDDEWRGVFDAVIEYLENPNSLVDKIFFDIAKNFEDSFSKFIQGYCNG